MNTRVIMEREMCLGPVRQLLSLQFIWYGPFHSFLLSGKFLPCKLRALSINENVKIYCQFPMVPAFIWLCLVIGDNYGLAFLSPSSVCLVVVPEDTWWFLIPFFMKLGKTPWKCSPGGRNCRIRCWERIGFNISFPLSMFNRRILFLMCAMK